MRFLLLIILFLYAAVWPHNQWPFFSFALESSLLAPVSFLHQPAVEPAMIEGSSRTGAIRVAPPACLLLAVVQCSCFSDLLCLLQQLSSTLNLFFYCEISPPTCCGRVQGNSSYGTNRQRVMEAGIFQVNYAVCSQGGYRQTLVCHATAPVYILFPSSLFKRGHSEKTTMQHLLLDVVVAKQNSNSR